MRIRKEWLPILKEHDMLQCSICGYNKCQAAIDYHHLDPKTKEFCVKQKLAILPRPETIEELEKCVAVCSNCHREIHSKNKHLRKNYIPTEDLSAYYSRGEYITAWAKKNLRNPSI